MSDKLIDDEEIRLALLRGYNILDTAPEDGFDDIVKLARTICETPIALVSLVEKDRQWFKAVEGLDVTETPIRMSICAHAIQSDDFLEVQDTTKDDRTKGNPLVIGDENIRFYAGALLKNENGVALGTLCVLDRKPRALNEVQRTTLEILAKQVMRHLELRDALGAAEMLRREVDHRVKNSLQSLEALIRIQARSVKTEEARDALEAVQGRLAMVSNLHEALYLSDAGAMVNLATFLDRVVQTASGQMPQGVIVRHEVEACKLESRAASSVGMVVNEAIANAAKYAFDGREKGAFEIVGKVEGEHYVLTCADDGGPAATGGVQTIVGTGLGTRIMQAAAQQLGGEIDASSEEKGHVVTLRWPLD
ncbi:putative sensor histidine kinase pdtaS [Sulfitobacter sp. THAF37]|uniref:histidine kinase dimerization/phosphoacceptor domain -containing protein n=1 Tax=Sulfitobacter sp. THAF37 TaxID=2587855 RepID=UPI001267BBB2|nr:histidine kinase dimerization/phosphoacceptor domain -containing protein [Sulfitobacter sp. THAF37]QFT57991.1 putative sensor histidine kinase pdtaS [Sulfitobacter sp. THAF37]